MLFIKRLFIFNLFHCVYDGASMNMYSHICECDSYETIRTKQKIYVYKYLQKMMCIFSQFSQLKRSLTLFSSLSIVVFTICMLLVVYTYSVLMKYIWQRGKPLVHLCRQESRKEKKSLYVICSRRLLFSSPFVSLFDASLHFNQIFTVSSRFFTDLVLDFRNSNFCC